MIAGAVRRRLRPNPGNLLMPDKIERRSGDRRTQQRRCHADNRRSAGRPYQLPRRLSGERRQNEGRRATNGYR